MRRGGGYVLVTSFPPFLPAGSPGKTVNLEASFQLVLPQEGTGASGAGESLSGPSGPGSPTYSGGGKNLLDDVQRRPGNHKMDSDTMTIRTRKAGPVRDEHGRFKRQDEMEVEAGATGATVATNDLGTNKELGVELTRLSDSDSGRSIMTASSVAGSINESRMWRKRAGPTGAITSDSESDITLGGTATPKVSKSTKGRGRPPTTGEYVGRAKAKQALNAALEEGLRLQAEAEIAEKARRVRSRGDSLLSDSSRTLKGEPSQSAAALNQLVLESVEVILDVAAKSGNLKGTFQRALKESAVKIRSAADILANRTTSEESRQVQADNARLQSEVSQLRKELDALRTELRSCREVRADKSPPRHQLDTEELMREMTVRIGTMVNARFAAIEDRLLPEQRLRPPLAADRAREGARDSAPAALCSAVAKGGPIKPPPKKKSRPEPAPVAVERETSPISSSLPAPAGRETGTGTQERIKKKKKKEKESLAAKEASGQAAEPQQHSSGSQAGKVEWTKVVGSRRKRADKKTLKVPRTSKGRKLRPPQSAAVTIVLQPGAEERGISYASVLAGAKRRLNLDDLGIKELKFRSSMSGARMFEIHGEAMDAQADALAERLRGILSPDAVKVLRPIKGTEIRIAELDDSVTAEEVTAAVAAQGGCSVEQIRAGAIIWGGFGSGAIWLRCPVAAAQKLADAGRIRVGWVSARVTLLDPRPLRCFKCLEVGHVSAKCVCPVDRTDLCFRCGQPGHKARNCSTSPHCAVCAAAGKPADHILGGKSCQDGKKGSMKPRRRQAQSRKVGGGSKSTKPTERAETQTMDTV